MMRLRSPRFIALLLVAAITISSPGVIPLSIDGASTRGGAAHNNEESARSLRVPAHGLGLSSKHDQRSAPACSLASDPGSLDEDDDIDAVDPSRIARSLFPSVRDLPAPVSFRLSAAPLGSGVVRGPRVLPIRC